MRIIHVLDALVELAEDFGISEQLGSILPQAEVDGLQNTATYNHLRSLLIY